MKILWALIFMLDSLVVPTTVPGDRVCMPSPAPDGSYIRLTALNTQSEMSALSPRHRNAQGELYDAQWNNGQEICWTNPSRNVDQSLLTDLQQVNMYWKDTPIVPADIPPPTLFRPVLRSVSQPQGEVVQTTILVGSTGRPVTLTWEAEGCTEVQVVRWGSTFPIVSGTFNGTTWDFTPPRAGLFSVRMRACDATEWIDSEDQGYMFYFKLEAPTGGGLG